MAGTHEWWQTGIVYQVYPRSFADSNGDGVGDLGGIISKLDYLKWLGVDAVWLGPIYPSPMDDFGYDVSDYQDVHPLFGTLEDFDRLVREAHARGLKVILDFVPNHTSDRHPWFAESRSSRGSAKRHWYIWKDARTGPGGERLPPNNWLSNFGGSAWAWDEATGQYYYHAFLESQPDLNWREPEVQEAMHGTMRFWLDRGVDGFRVDVIWHIAKDEEFRDNPVNPGYRPGQNPHHEVISTYEADRPEVHGLIAGMRAVLDDYPPPGSRMMVGEVYLPVQRMMSYYGSASADAAGEGGGAAVTGTGCHMPFNFQLVTMRWDARLVGEAVAGYEAALPAYGWPNWVLGNHDNPRIASRVGPAQARVAAVLLLTLRGTPTVYYGDELGMRDVPIPPDRVMDPFERRVPGLGLGRDPERTPMRWDASPNAGFCAPAVQPWLPVGDDWKSVNVEAQAGEPGSMLTLYRRLIALRRNEPALTVGSYEPVSAGEDVLAYARREGERAVLVALNFGRQRRRVDLHGVGAGTVVLSTDGLDEERRVEEVLELRPDEAVIVRLANS